MNDREYELIIRIVAAEAARRGPLTIFDAGCGTGRLCQLMQPYGAVSGCDLSERAIALAQQRGLRGITCQDLNRLSLEPGRYDVITCIDVLYHRWVTDDIAVLTRLRDALKPDGMLILNLVAWPFLFSDHDLAVQTRERYTRPLLKARLAAGGFSSERLTYRVGLLFPPIAAYRLLTRRPARDTPATSVTSDVHLPPAWLNRTLLALMRIENGLLARSDLPVGTSLFAVARRGASDHFL